MYSVKSRLVREKRFRMGEDDYRKRGSHHTADTLTDDHTLFLLHQQREMLAKKPGKFRFLRFWR